MTDYKVTNTAKFPMYVGDERFDPGETRTVSLTDEEVEQARRAFVFEETSDNSEEEEEPEEVQEESKPETNSISEDGGDE